MCLRAAACELRQLGDASPIGLPHLRRSTPKFTQGREKYAKATPVMAKVLYYIQTTPATLHRARTRILLFYISIQSNYKNIKHFWGPGFPQEERHRDEPGGLLGGGGLPPTLPQPVVPQ